MLSKAEKDFMAAVNAGIHAKSAVLDSADYGKIFDIAMQQKLLPFVFEAVRKAPAAEENAELFAAIKQQVIAQVLSQTVRSLEFEEVYKKLTAAGLRPILVKGRTCGRLYPLPDHRLSADDDIFVSENDFLPCHKILLGEGFEASCSEAELSSEDEVSYTSKKSAVYIEMHRRLFDSSEDAHDELNGFFADAHAYSLSTNGFFIMRPHESLLYLILHAYKHFVSCGIGMRQFCDIALWAKKYYADIDWTFLHEQCESVHAAGFAAAVFEIANKYLGIELALPYPWKPSAPCEPLLEDTLCGGIYGSNDYTRLHSSTVTLNAVRSSRDGKKRGVLSSVFPNKKYMERKYSYVKKHPWLLPAAWAQRIFHYMGEKRGSGDNSGAGSVKLAKERIELMKMYKII